MTTTVLISCDIESTDYSVPLGMEIWLDSNLIQAIDPVSQATHVEFTVDDADAQHELWFKLKNKQAQHTQIDSNNQIIKDATVKIANVEFDGIPLGQVLTKLAEYHHNFNDTAAPTVNKFYGEMGCNGLAVLKFTTPIYLWMLDHL